MVDPEIHHIVGGSERSWTRGGVKIFLNNFPYEGGQTTFSPLKFTLFSWNDLSLNLNGGLWLLDHPPPQSPPLRSSSLNFSNSFSILYFTCISVFHNNYITHLLFDYQVKREIKNTLARSILLEIRFFVLINRENYTLFMVYLFLKIGWVLYE